MRIITYSLSEASTGYGTPSDPYEMNTLNVRGNYVVKWTTFGDGIFSVNLHDMQQAVFADQTPYHLITLKVNGNVVKSDTSRLIETNNFGTHVRLSGSATIELVFSGSADALTYISRFHSFVTSDSGVDATTTPPPETTQEPLPLNVGDEEYDEWVQANGLFVGMIKYEGGCGPYEMFLDASSTGNFYILDDNQLWFIGDTQIAGEYTATIVLRNATETKYEYVPFEIIDCTNSIAPCDDFLLDDDIPVPIVKTSQAIGCLEGGSNILWQVVFRERVPNDLILEQIWSWDANRAYRIWNISSYGNVFHYEVEPFEFFISYRYRDPHTGRVGEWGQRRAGDVPLNLCEQLPTLPEVPENPSEEDVNYPECPPLPPDPEPPLPPVNPDPNPCYGADCTPVNPPDPDDPDSPDPCVGSGCGDNDDNPDPDNPNPPTCCNPPPGNPEEPPGCVGDGCEPDGPGGPGNCPGGTCGPGGPGPGDPDERPPSPPPSPQPACGSEAASITKLFAEIVDDDETNVSVSVVAYLFNSGSHCEDLAKKLGKSFGDEVARVDLTDDNLQGEVNIGTFCPDCLDVCVLHGDGGVSKLTHWQIKTVDPGTEENPDPTESIFAESTQESRETCVECGDGDLRTEINALLPTYDYTEGGVQYQLTGGAYAAGNLALSTNQFIGFKRNLQDNECLVSTSQKATEGTAFKLRTKVYVLRCSGGRLSDVSSEVIGCEVMNHRAWKEPVFESNKYSVDENQYEFGHLTYEQIKGTTWPDRSDAPDYDKSMSPLKSSWTLDVPFCQTCCSTVSNNPTSGVRPAATNSLPINLGYHVNNLYCGVGGGFSDPNFEGSTLWYNPGGAGTVNWVDGDASPTQPCIISAYRAIIKDNATGNTWVKEYSLADVDYWETTDLEVITGTAALNVKEEDTTSGADGPNTFEYFHKGGGGCVRYTADVNSTTASVTALPRNADCSFAGFSSTTVTVNGGNGIPNPYIHKIPGTYTYTQDANWNIQDNGAGTSLPDGTSLGIGRLTYILSTYSSSIGGSSNYSGDNDNPLP